MKAADMAAGYDAKKVKALAGRLGLTWSEIADLRDSAEHLRGLAGYMYERRDQRALIDAADVLERRWKEAEDFRCAAIVQTADGYEIRRKADGLVLRTAQSFAYAKKWTERHGYKWSDEGRA